MDKYEEGNEAVSTSKSLRKESTLDNSFDHEEPEQLEQHLKLVENFSVSLGSKVLFLSFAQRRHIGFRKGVEFDRKRILVASQYTFKIFGFDLNEKPQELLYATVPENEEIKMISFADDCVPCIIILVTYDHDAN